MNYFVTEGTNMFDSVALVYESLIADHLASDGGVEWEQRSVSIAVHSVNAKKLTMKAPPLSAPAASRPTTVKLNVKLASPRTPCPSSHR